MARMNRFPSFALATLGLFLFCLGGAPSAVKADSELKIGWIGPLTGRAAVLGVDAVPAMELAIEELNKRPEARKIKLVVEDDSYETAKTLAAYQRLVHEEGIRVIFVFTNGGLFALAPRAGIDGVVLIDTLDCDEKIAALPENVICISKSTENLAEVLVNAALKAKDTPIGLIYYNSDPFMGILGDSALGFLKHAGADAPYAEGYAAGTTDFRTMLLHANAKGIKSLFFFGYDEMGIAMKQARQAGMKEPFYTINTITSPGFRESAQDSEIGSYVSTFQAPRTKAFEEFDRRFREKTGREISFEVSTMPSYDVTKIIGERIGASTHDRTDADAVKKILYDTKGYQGLSGEITVDSDGACRSLKNSLFRMEKEGLVPVKN